MSTHIMLDLETMGTTPDAAIAAIGAAALRDTDLQVADSFYVVTDLQSAAAQGGALCADTVRWWLAQADAARLEIAGPGMHISVALQALTHWMRKMGPPEELLVWGNGGDFDPVILGGAYRRAGLPQPWGAYNSRCYRTLRKALPSVPPPARTGTKHHAGDDAMHQALHLASLLRSLAP